MSLFGLDIGTSGCKGVAFDVAGNPLAQSYRENGIISPQPGWAELNPDALWKNVGQIIKECSFKTKSDPIEALSISAQGEAFLPVDKNLNPLYNVIISFDNRALKECNWLMEHLGKERIFEITGMPPHLIHSVNKIMWLKKNQSAIYKKTWKFLCLEDFIQARLGIKPLIGYSLAARTMMFDVRQKRWSDEILNRAGIDKDLLPQAADLGQIAGEIGAAPCKELGLKKGAFIVVGGHDAICSAVGAGVIKPGMTMVVSGTSEGILSVADGRVNKKRLFKGNYAYYCFTGDKKVVAGYNSTGGLLLKWFRNNFEISGDIKINKINSYQLMIDNATDTPVKVFILPHFVGSGTPHLDHRSKGVIIGLTLSTTKQDLHRAMLDSLSYEILINIKFLETAGIRIKEVYVVGGGAQSEKWLQIKADVWGRKVCALRNPEAACLGCAVVAGVGIGKFKSLDQGVKRMSKVEKSYHPHEAMRAEYAELFEVYRKIYPNVERLYGEKLWA